MFFASQISHRSDLASHDLKSRDVRCESRDAKMLRLKQVRGNCYMAQDNFETPPDPKKGHGMTKKSQKNKKYSRVGQVTTVI